MRARFVTSILSAGLLLLTADPAGAGGGRDADAFVPEDGDPTAVASDVETTETSSSGGAPSDCHWEVAIADDFVATLYDLDSGEQIHSETGRWLRKICDGALVEVNGQTLIPEGGAVNPRNLAVEARASTSIPLPPISTSPDASRKLYVQVPTWLWLDEGWWHPYSATAVAGRVTSTVTVVPTSVTWTLGDGNSTTCSGPGEAWTRGANEAGACTHTYRTSSAGASTGTFPIEATVTFSVTWASNTGVGGTLSNIARTSTVDVVVGEIQAIVTS